MKDNKQKSLKWWNELPIQNLYDMRDSWVGYVKKYLPYNTDIYHLSNDEILYIWLQEHKLEIRKYKIIKLIKKYG